ncbi:hypothetical protein LAG90_04935 [Marinilongibacter aquaticus]|uniref:hypothetical protein n=1 Tax=Marinilongibacter aquaticus TaxID=2975157 RepID=UPI0021BD7A88|nr:hypothetical protein [Marinilongibacter aquaticus]UBM59994.1 hypothetical protein LAG90_04935 [Marinilongibacter aquaticus]
MATWTKFYIKTDKVEELVQSLLKLTGNLNVLREQEFPNDIGKYRRMSLKPVYPNYMVVGQPQEGWVTVTHNSLSNLASWGESLSKQLETTCVLTSVQTASSTCHLGIYEKGSLIREIRVADTRHSNKGKALDFEEGLNPDLEHFDFSDMEAYCRCLGLELQGDYRSTKWTVLRPDELRNEMPDLMNEIRKMRPSLLQRILSRFRK